MLGKFGLRNARGMMRVVSDVGSADLFPEGEHFCVPVKIGSLSQAEANGTYFRKEKSMAWKSSKTDHSISLDSKSKKKKKSPFGGRATN